MIFLHQKPSRKANFSSRDLAIKEKLVNLVADGAAFDGWSVKALKDSAEELGISYEKARSLFPRIGIDLAKAYHHFKDQEFLTKFRKIDTSNFSHTEKVEIAMRMRFQAMADKKAAFRRSMALFALPIYQIEGINLVWSTCDLIWLEIRDQSSGFSWYTKRLALVSVYLSTLLFFFGDESVDHVETENFINRRLLEIGKLGKLKFDFLDFIQKLSHATR